MMAAGKKDTIVERRRRLISRILALDRTLEDDLRYAFETYFENNAELYFDLEEKLLRIQTLFETLQDQTRAAETIADISRIVGRVNYVEDCLDDMGDRLYRRRRHKKRRSRVSDFFARYHEQKAEGTLHQAYAALELQEGATLLEATAMFRHLAKKYHPDARRGDRSHEAALRRIVGAYQCIKEYFASPRR